MNQYADLVIDHIYICVTKQAPEAKALQDAGMQLASGTDHHTGQGTAAVFFYFENIYLELIWVEDAEELKSADKQLADKFKNVTNGGSPFGLGLRKRVPSDAPEANMPRHEYWICSPPPILLSSNVFPLLSNKRILH